MNGMPSSQDELIFWDRIKKVLEPMGTYDDFLKLLSLYSSEVVELQALVEQAEHFLGDVGNGELLAQFKDLVGWDDRSQSSGRLIAFERARPIPGRRYALMTGKA